MTPPRRVPEVRTIAVLRANALGDYILSLPALEALRSAYPQARIVLLGAGWHARLLGRRPGPYDRVEAVPDGVVGVTAPSPRPGHPIPPEPPELGRFIERIRAERFDVAIQLHGGGRYSNPLVRRLGARLTVGMATPDAPRLDRWVRYIHYQPEVFRYLEVVGLIGATPVGYRPRFPVVAEDLAEAKAAVPDSDRPVVALHPGARDPRRRWPPKCFAHVADALAAAGADVVITGGASETELVDEVVAQARRPVRALAGALSLGGLAGLYARCRLVVANDTGPLHLADAVGAATVGLYWVGNLINVAPVERGRHRPLCAWTTRCPVCGVDCMHPDHPGGDCGHQVSFIADIPVDEVLAQAFDLLRH